MTTHAFTIDVVGWTAQQASDLLVGNEPLFTMMMADQTPQIAKVKADESTRCSATRPTMRSRLVNYELDPMVWAPLQTALQVAVPGLIRYTDTVLYRTDMPGWSFESAWEGVPGIDPRTIQIKGGARVTEDGPMGCRVHYTVTVKCTLPLVGGVVERAVVDGFHDTCRGMSRLLQDYAVVWHAAQTDRPVGATLGAARP